MVVGFIIGEILAEGPPGPAFALFPEPGGRQVFAEILIGDQLHDDWAARLGVWAVFRFI